MFLVRRNNSILFQFHLNLFLLAHKTYNSYICGFFFLLTAFLNIKFVQNIRKWLELTGNQLFNVKSTSSWLVSESPSTFFRSDVFVVFKIFEEKVDLLSISSTFYMWIYCTIVFLEAFLQLHFGFVIFWRKNIGPKGRVKCWWNWH